MTLQPKPLDKFKYNLETILTQNIKALPSDVNADRLKLNALMYISQDAKLMALAQEKPSVMAQIVYNFVALGLDMSNREVYIIPFGSTPTVIRDYKGEEKLAKKYSVKEIKTIKSNIVRSTDEQGFDEEGHFFHRYNAFATDSDRGEIIGAYCKVVYVDDSYDLETVNIDEIKKVRAVSKTANSPDSVWNKWAESMWRKTAVKKAMKHIPLDFKKLASDEVAATIEKAYKTTDNDFAPSERINNDEVIQQTEPLEVIDVEFTEK